VRVEISHTVDRVEEQVYNFLTYDFRTSDGLIRARAYTDTIKSVTVLGRLNSDGSMPDVVKTFQDGYAASRAAEIQLEAARAAFEAMNPRSSPEFSDVLSYLRDRFPEVALMGPQGRESITGVDAPQETGQ
jgi:hypothetical protein